MEIKRVILVWIYPTELPEIRIPLMCRWRGIKKEVYQFAHEFGLEIFFLYREINNLEIEFWVENMLVASYSRAVIAQKMCSKVTLGHRFESNFWMVKNFWTRPKCFRKYTFGAWIWAQILYFFVGNQKSYSRLNMSYRVTRNTDSNYVPMEGHKKGSLTIRSRIWLGNIFPISRDQ